MRQRSLSEGHDFAQKSREAYYSWAVRWLKNDGKPLSEPVKEPAMQLPDAKSFRVWGDDLPKPHNAVTWDALIEWLKGQANSVIEGMRPTDKKSLQQFQRLMRPALQVTLAVSVPTAEQIVATHAEQKEVNGLLMARMWLGRKGVGDKIPAVFVPLSNPPAKKQLRREVILLVSEKGAASEVWNGEGESAELVKLLTRFDVMAIDAFRTGMVSGERKTDVQFFVTYNRTDDAERIQDIVTAITHLRQEYDRVHIVGIGAAGLWVLMAAAVVELDGKIVVDANRFDANDDNEFVKRLFVPCLRRIGDLRTALALIAPRPLLVHNIHPNFPRNWAESAYAAANATQRLLLSEKPIAAKQISDWLISPAK
jgi:hypothetical protein